MRLIGIGPQTSPSAQRRLTACHGIYLSLRSWHVYFRRRSLPLCIIWVANIAEAPQSLHLLPNVHLAAQVISPRQSSNQGESGAVSRMLGVVH